MRLLWRHTLLKYTLQPSILRVANPRAALSPIHPYCTLKSPGDVVHDAKV